MSKQQAQAKQATTPAPDQGQGAYDALGNAARAEQLGLHQTGRDTPSTGPMGVDLETWVREGLEDEPLATTTAGQTTLSDAAVSHPQRSTIEAHEEVHCQQHQRYLEGAPAANREALEAEAQRGSEALEAGQAFEAQLGATPSLTLAFTPSNEDWHRDEQNSLSPEWCQETEGSSDAKARDLMRDFENLIDSAMEMRVQAIDFLHQHVEKGPVPQLERELLVMAATVGLSAATAGIATAVAGRVVHESSKVISEFVKVGTEEFLKNGVKSAIEDALAGSPNDWILTYFHKQKELLLRAGKSLKTAWNTRGYHDFLKHIEGSEDPCNEAMKTWRELDLAFEVAGVEQYDHSLTAWCLALAQSQAGSGERGTDLGQAVIDAWSMPLLQDVMGAEVDGTIYITVGQPSRESRDIEVLDARIEGLHPDMMANLEKRTIAEMGIPVIVTGKVSAPQAWSDQPPAFFDAFDQVGGHLMVGRNESGEVWNRSTPGGDFYLAGHWCDDVDVYKLPDLAIGMKVLGEMADHGVERFVEHELLPKKLSDWNVKLDN